MDFKNKVVYEMYPKSFLDSNKDGIGDLRGAVEKLPYLHYLGIDYIWLTPFYKSPQNDNGYDITDYCSIDPIFGSIDDFKTLIREAAKYDISIMLDMVFNHTSTTHQWFQKALKGDKKYQDYYFFKDGTEDKAPTNWKSKFGGSAWKYVPELKKWYLHLFDVTQADLNWENKAVRDELKSVITFWKKMGVKGFRFDVINLISKPHQFIDDYDGDGKIFYTDGPKVHTFLKELVADTKIKNFITVGEMSSTTLEACAKYAGAKEKELSMCFNFHHLKVDYYKNDKWQLMQPDIEKLKDILVYWQTGMQENDASQALFWSNHDQPRVVSRFGDDKKYWAVSAKMLATSMYLLRGIPYIYQGEEIGMTNADFTQIEQYKDVESTNYYKILQEQGKSQQEAMHILNVRSRDNSRTPMQWNAENNAGFTDGKPWLGVNENYLKINVEDEMHDPKSILSYYRQLLKLRKEKCALTDGKIKFMYREIPNLFAYTRYIGSEKIVVMNNFSAEKISLKNELANKVKSVLLGNYDDGYTVGESIVLRPYESMVLELKS